MPAIPADVAAVKDSFGRAILAGDVIQRFYDIFLVSNPDIAPRFKNTDFARQKGLLRQGINLAIMFAEGTSIGKSGIGRIRTTHAKDQLAIPPALYKYWLDSLVKAVGEFDPKFTADLGKAWRQVMQVAVDHIAEGYSQTAAPQRKGA